MLLEGAFEPVAASFPSDDQLGRRWIRRVGDFFGRRDLGSNAASPS